MEEQAWRVMRPLLLLFALGLPIFPAPVRAMSARALLAHHPCMVVAVEMLDSVDSATARTGEFFRFQSINAVTVGNTIVIPARTYGYGTVVIASPAGRSGRAGTLVLEPRYFVMPDGRKLGVVLDHHASGLISTGASGEVPGYLGAIPLPGVGAAIGIFNYFHNGKNVNLPRGTVFAVFPSDDPSVARCDAHPEY